MNVWGLSRSYRHQTLREDTHDTNHRVFSSSTKTTKMSSEDSVRRNIVKRSSLEEANRYIYPNLTHETTVNGLATTPGTPYPFFVPSTVKSTLGSPVRIYFTIYREIWLTVG